MALRKIEVQRKNGEFEDIGTLRYIFAGDVFRMFEPTGEPVVHTDGRTVFLAISEPYYSVDHNEWVVDIDSLYNENNLH